eukprot:TRINITY_DN1424_c0_g1_i1.p1 TRINITY_DN1424_c0_g1~~TRINITY_DN1424_c0_g1_i1.p1  ORF type:complete len:427 (+),score=87.11 TRINITY_DN1424_c0_g1_i1:128-1408(+)
MAQWKLPYKDLKFNKKIGKGNFGEVYDGEYLGTRVAIKKLYFVDDDFMQKYIEREMDTLTGLAHPNIVQLIGLCIETDDMYIVTEFVSGGDLRSRLKDESMKMDWLVRLGIARDIALAMNYLHSKNIMHRDLKSHNLLVAESWKVKVCDFGLARSAPSEGDRNLMTIVGTNEWMAPEVAMGENYTLSADVFSYGMVLYEIITREKPPQRMLKDLYAFQADEYKPKISPETPEPFWQLLIDCTSLSGESRPTFKDIVKRLLAMIKDHQSKSVAKPPASAEKSNGDKPKKTKTKKKTDSKKGPTETKTSKSKSSEKKTTSKKAKSDDKKKPEKKTKTKTKTDDKSKPDDKKSSKVEDKKSSKVEEKKTSKVEEKKTTKTSKPPAKTDEKVKTKKKPRKKSTKKTDEKLDEKKSASNGKKKSSKKASDK